MLPISADIIERVDGPALSPEDVFGRFGPDEWSGLGIVQDEVVVDRLFQIIDAGVTSPPDAPDGDFGEEAFHQVHPGGAGGREVQPETRMLFEPGHDLGRLVGGVVVKHEMDVARLSDRPVDPA